MSDKIGVAEVRNEYELAARVYIRRNNEFNRGRMSGLEAALSWLGVDNDKICEMYKTCEEEVRDEQGREADESPINIYWRKAQGEPILQTAASDFQTAKRKRDELIKAGCIDIQMIVKGKKKEVIRK